MRVTLRRFLSIVFLVLPLMTFAQNKMIVYDGITGIYNTIIQNDTVQVSTLVPKSPADKAGMRFRDQIIMINDSLVSGRGFNSWDVKQLLYGRSGESVDLKIKRSSEDSLITFSFQRDPYLYQISTFDYEYMVDSLEQWDINDIMSNSMDSLFINPLTTKCLVHSVDDDSPAAKNGILQG